MAKLRILGHNFDIRYDPQHTREQGVSGQCCLAGNWIVIDSTMVKSQQEATFVHEIIEAVNWILGLELPHKTIEQLEAGLYSVIADNPKYLSINLPEKIKDLKR